MWLGANSAFKAESDLAKYEKARKLKDYIVTIRKNYTADWDSSDLRKKQVGVVDTGEAVGIALFGGKEGRGLTPLVHGMYVARSTCGCATGCCHPPSPLHTRPALTLTVWAPLPLPPVVVPPLSPPPRPPPTPPPQMAVAVYFLDKLALRAGHEKDDDEADTVGCCTLKVRGCGASRLWRAVPRLGALTCCVVQLAHVTHPPAPLLTLPLTRPGCGLTVSAPPPSAGCCGHPVG